MCTVTFIPTKAGFTLTSNRDEQSSRPTLSPKKYLLYNQDLYFPKDKIAGGTWIAKSNKKKTACLLNGAFERHERKNKYIKSRGLILLESFSYNKTEDFVNDVQLKGVEPFTLLLLNHENASDIKFTELRWDEKEKHIKKINTTSPQIWSSATLYDTDAIQKREELFENWIKEHSLPENKDILNFHNKKHGLQESIDIIMKRENELMTLSISQLIVKHQALEYIYLDLIENKEYFLKIPE